ncbi:MAG: hypothetical protein KC621_30935, partial [Myxococcales bacterium]|nr:hypothetical protein [Myxococcales bacterium]
PAPTDPLARASTLTAEGADQVRFIGPAGTFPPGPVPPGEYRVMATFGGTEVPAGKVVVEPGASVVLRCDPSFMRCRAR